MYTLIGEYIFQKISKKKMHRKQILWHLVYLAVFLLFSYVIDSPEKNPFFQSSGSLSAWGELGWGCSVGTDKWKSIFKLFTLNFSYKQGWAFSFLLFCNVCLYSIYALPIFLFDCWPLTFLFLGTLSILKKSAPL